MGLTFYALLASSLSPRHQRSAYTVETLNLPDGVYEAVSSDSARFVFGERIADNRGHLPTITRSTATRRTITTSLRRDLTVSELGRQYGLPVMGTSRLCTSSQTNQFSLLRSITVYSPHRRNMPAFPALRENAEKQWVYQERIEGVFSMTGPSDRNVDAQT